MMLFNAYGLSNATSGGGTSGIPSATIGIIVGSVVGGVCVLTATAVAAFLVLRSRQQRKRAYLDLVASRAEKGQGPGGGGADSAGGPAPDSGKGPAVPATQPVFVVMSDEELTEKVGFLSQMS